MNRDEAREYFKSKGLTYAMVTADDIEILRDMLNIKFSQQRIDRIQDMRERPGRGKPIYWDYVHSRIKGSWNKNGTMASAYLFGKGAYFDSREVISFDRDGFIGFCGAADSQNTEPVLEAFTEWCDYLEERNNAQ